MPDSGISSSVIRIFLLWDWIIMADDNSEIIMAENAQYKRQMVNFLNNASFLLVLLNVKIGLLSIIDIYSGGGIKVIIRRKIIGGK
jgi:hypothetical protein